MTKLIAKNLCKNYGKVQALCGVSFEVFDGDFVNVMGESGCGKTTLLKCLCGVERLTSGELYHDDEVLNNVDVQQRNVAFVSQEFSLFPNMTVFENVLFALKKQRGSYDEKCAAVWDILHKTGLEDIQNAFPKELSYGQRQKTAIARALVKHPKIVLFDEPLSNMDVASKAVYKSLILQVKNAFPDSVYLYVTHNGADAMALGNKTLVMSRGKVLQFGETEEVFSSPCTQEVAQICLEGCLPKQGTVCDGFISTEEGNISLNPYYQATLSADVGQAVSVVGRSNRTAVFDVDGNSVCGRLYQVRLPCEISRNALLVDGNSFPLDELSDGVVHTGKCIAEFFADKIFGDFVVDAETPDGQLSFVAQVIFADEKFVVCRYAEQKISIRIKNFEHFTPVDVVGKHVRLFVELSEVRLFTAEGNVAVADYRVYPNVCQAMVLNAAKGVVSVGGTKLTLPFAVGKDKTVCLEFSVDCFTVSRDKKQLAVKRVLNIQYGKTKTLVFAYINGFDKYVTFEADNNVALSEQVTLIPNLTKVKIV